MDRALGPAEALSPPLAKKRGHSGSGGFCYIYLFAPRVIPEALSLVLFALPLITHEIGVRLLRSQWISVSKV